MKIPVVANFVNRVSHFALSRRFVRVPRRTRLHFSYFYLARGVAYARAVVFRRETFALVV